MGRFQRVWAGLGVDSLCGLRAGFPCGSTDHRNAFTFELKIERYYEQKNVSGNLGRNPPAFFMARNCTFA